MAKFKRDSRITDLSNVLRVLNASNTVNNDIGDGRSGYSKSLEEGIRHYYAWKMAVMFGLNFAVYELPMHSSLTSFACLICF